MISKKFKKTNLFVSNNSFVLKFNSELNTSKLLSYYITYPSSIIYVTKKNVSPKCNQIPYTIGYTKSFYELSIDEIHARFAPIFIQANSIMIPKKVEYNLKRHVSKKELKNINKDENIAIELCLIFLSNLSSTYYIENKWKSLNSTYLHKQSKRDNDNTYIYLKIKKLLKNGTKKNGKIIEVFKNENYNESYKIGKTSKQFRLSSTYLKPGLIEYIIQNDELINKRRHYIQNIIKESSTNVICRNLFYFYEKVSFPTKNEILVEAKRLVKGKYKTKKGKRLTFKNKHSKNHWKNSKERSFVENNIKLFEYLTKRGFMIPQQGSVASGGRVVDSFTLMPSWIRNMCKVDGKRFVEVDYSTLHPNIAMNIYGGSCRSISHSEVAEHLEISRLEAKVEHLSFFNKKWDNMLKSPLFEYYAKNEPDMLQNLYKDKNENGHKITSKRLFQMEVQIMTQVIKELNNMNIYVGYVYDALICSPKQKYVVTSVMNKVVKEFNVKTHV